MTQSAATDLQDQSRNSRRISGQDVSLLRRFTGFLRPYETLLFGALVALGVGSLAQLARPYLLNIGIDRYIIPGELDGIDLIVFLYGLTLFLGWICTFLQTYLLGNVAHRVSLSLRDVLYGKVHRLPMSYYDTQPVGVTVTRLTNDVESLSELVTSGVIALIADIFILVGIVVVMLWMNLEMALITFSLLPVLFWLTWIFRGRVRQSFREIRTRLSRLNAFLNEHIQGMRVIRAFHAEEQVIEDHANRNAQHMESHLSSIRNFAIYSPLVALVGYLSVPILIGFGSVRILQGELTIGILVAFLAYVQMFFRPVRDMADKYNLLQASFSAMEKVFGFLDLTEEPRFGTAQVLKIEGRIEFDQVYFAYDPNNGDPAPNVLHGISFEIPKGGRIGLVGATGSGKSTIANMIIGFYTPKSGVVNIDGRPLSDYRLPEMRRRIAYVTQEPFLFSGSIEENVSLGDPEISPTRVRQAIDEVGLLGSLERFPNGLKSKVVERGMNLSAGERQLVALARALAFNPDLLILDEATAEIDRSTEAMLQKALDRLCEDCTALLIAHRLSTVRSCDRILVLNQGRLAESGTHNELMEKDGIYASLYRLQEVR